MHYNSLFYAPIFSLKVLNPLLLSLERNCFTMKLNIKEEKYCKEIGLRIKKLRQEAGLTQEELAEMIQVHNTYIGKIERGHIIPSLKLLIAIANKLNVNLIYLFQIEKKSKAKKSLSDLITLLKDLSDEDIKFIANIAKFLLKKSRK